MIVLLSTIAYFVGALLSTRYFYQGWTKHGKYPLDNSEAMSLVWIFALWPLAFVFAFCSFVITYSRK